MAGVPVDVLLERLATLAFDKIGRELKLVVGVKQEIKKLTKKLKAIRAVLEDAEQRQVMEASVKDWLDELTDVSFDMDDVLDEWITRVEKQETEDGNVDMAAKKKVCFPFPSCCITRVEKHQLEKQETEDGNVDVAAKKVCFPFPSSCFRFGQVHYPLFLRHEIAKKIEELNERLALIDQNKQSFNFQNITRAVPELPQRQKTTSLPNVKTFGRDNEKNLIVSKLLSESSEGNEVPLIIPILGMGGMGKTSLANLVYNDENIKSHFDKRIWVCVSDPFEEIKIAKAIVKGLRVDNPSDEEIKIAKAIVKGLRVDNPSDEDRDHFEEIKIALRVDNPSDELESLLKQISDSIGGKKFLLVLDDVWSPRLSQWEELIKPLRNGATSSKVLVTTRKEEVATLMEATTHVISLKELGVPFCLSLLYYSAGVDENNVSGEFSDVGLEIVKKCNGLPLAAKTLGRLMRNKKKIEEWRAILDSKTWELKEIEQDVFQPLLLSYHDLDLAVKRCLLYCVLFPKDYVYDKTCLIEIWMSQDYLNVKGSKRDAKAGQNYFHDLVRRSFFQDVEVDIDNGNIRCKIHDVVHDFLQYLTKNEFLISVDGEIKEVANDNVRHLNIVPSRVGHYPEVSFNFNCTKLRTVLGRFTIAGQPGPIFAQSTGLRVLDLGGKFKDPMEIGGLIHLRYLDLSDNESLSSLPSAIIGSLYNLQTLRLNYCRSLKELDVRKLINLRHLYVGGCISLRLIKGIAKLRDLQRLDCFNVGMGEEGNKLEDLKDVMNQLQGSLQVRICPSTSAAETAGILVNMRHIVHLSLDFDSKTETQETLLNGLEPHPALEYLKIWHYYGGAFSRWWLSLHCLRVLKLLHCFHCESLPPLGKLASLEILQILGLSVVTKVGVEFLGIEQGQTSSSSTFISFPKLKQLEFSWMGSWQVWEVAEEENSENFTFMACLSHLKIWNCEKLKALPEFLWKTPLQQLEIIGSRILQNLYKQGKGEEWAKISHIPSIKMED